MKIVFAGTPEIAVPSLVALATHHEVCAVLTAPDTIAGRGRELQASAVKAKAQELGISVLCPQRLDAEVRDLISPLGADLLVCFAYGKIFGPKFLGLFPRGGINIHPSLLPKYRGPSPISAAILQGDPETGLSIQTLALEMDAGDILYQTRVPLSPEATTATMTAYFADLGASALIDCLGGLEAGTLAAVPQSTEGISFCHMVSKDMGHIDWSRPALEIERMVRAFDPWPRAYTSLGGLNLQIHKATVLHSDGSHGSKPLGSVVGIDKERGILVQTGSGILAVQVLQLQGKKAMDHGSFINGNRNLIGTLWGAPDGKV